MRDELEPLPPDVAAVLEPLAEAPAPRLSAAQRASLLRRIDASVATAAALGTSAEPGPSPSAASPAAPAAPASSVAAALGAGKAVVLAVAAFAAGAGVSRVAFPPAPQVVERVVVVERPTPAPVEAPPVDPVEVAPPRPVVEAPPRAEKPAARPPPPGVASSRERQFIEVARTALLKRDAAGALSALASHRAAFQRGQLAEERDSLEVQALALAGRLDEARAAAARFKAAYPDSVFGPVVDAAVR